jgi:hypothetical protein
MSAGSGGEMARRLNWGGADVDLRSQSTASRAPAFEVSVIEMDLR